MKTVKQIIEVCLYCPAWLVGLLWLVALGCYLTGWLAVTLNTPAHWSRFGWTLLAALIPAAVARVWAWLRRK